MNVGAYSRVAVVNINIKGSGNMAAAVQIDLAEAVELARTDIFTVPDGDVSMFLTDDGRLEVHAPMDASEEDMRIVSQVATELWGDRPRNSTECTVEDVVNIFTVWPAA